jgi:hypothetical protein
LFQSVSAVYKISKQIQQSEEFKAMVSEAKKTGWHEDKTSHRTPCTGPLQIELGSKQENAQRVKSQEVQK